MALTWVLTLILTLTLTLTLILTLNLTLTPTLTLTLTTTLTLTLTEPRWRGVTGRDVGLGDDEAPSLFPSLAKLTLIHGLKVGIRVRVSVRVRALTLTLTLTLIKDDFVPPEHSTRFCVAAATGVSLLLLHLTLTPTPALTLTLRLTHSRSGLHLPPSPARGPFRGARAEESELGGGSDGAAASGRAARQWRRRCSPRGGTGPVAGGTRLSNGHDDEDGDG